MTSKYSSNDPASWQQVFSDSYQATSYPGSYTRVYVPIPLTEIAVDIDSPLIAVHCTSTQYPSQVKYVGSVIQAVNNPSSLPTQTSGNKGKGIYSNRTTFAEFTEFSESYRLLLSPKFYVEQLTVTVYKYIGVVNEGAAVDVAEVLEELLFLQQQISIGFSDIRTNLAETFESSTAQRADILKQTNQIDAGIYALAEGLASLLPQGEAEALRQVTQYRLQLDLGYL